MPAHENHNTTFKVNGINVYKILPKAFHNYRNITRGNSKISYLTARKKLTRNIQVSLKFDSFIDKHGEECNIYHYGSLQIITRGDTIVYVDKLKERNEDFIFHKRKAEKVSNRLELKFEGKYK